MVRTGQTELDEQGRIAGNLDVPLSDTGQKQIESLVKEFADWNIAKIACGPGTAARQTADLIAADRKIKVKVEEELRSFDCGLWHGMRIEELKENQPKLFKLWQEQPQSVQPPGGDSPDDAVSRVTRFVKKLTRRPKNETIIVVASEPIACILRSLLEEKDLSKYWTVEPNCGTWFEFIRDLQSLSLIHI